MTYSNDMQPLRALRIAKGYERPESLAAKMGCSAGTLNTWELRGGVTDTVYFFKNLADSLDLTMDELYYELVTKPKIEPFKKSKGSRKDVA